MASYLLGKGNASALYVTPVLGPAYTYGRAPWFHDRYVAASAIGAPVGDIVWLPVKSSGPAVNSSRNLVSNPDFAIANSSNAKLASEWVDIGHDSYTRQTAVTRAGHAAAIEVVSTATTQAGATFTWTAPEGHPLKASQLILSGWSKAVADGGGAQRDYSLYVDLIYADKTPLFGQVAPFATGAHDWQNTQKLIALQKPVAEIRINCLFRRRVGRVYFDGISLTAHAAPHVDVASRLYTRGFVAANPSPLGTPPYKVVLPAGKMFLDLTTNKTVSGTVLLPARNATVLLSSDTVPDLGQMKNDDPHQQNETRSKTDDESPDQLPTH